MYKCLIVDDEPVARQILESHLEKTTTIEVVKNCKNAMEAFLIISNEKIDLIFLDINMPEISGLSFAKSINKSIKVIFTTAHREYAVEGFNLQAVDYLLKPISFERFQQAINKFLGENSAPQLTEKSTLTPEKSDFIFIRSDRKMIKIDFEDIYFVESLKDYIKIHTSQKTIVARETITNIEIRLPNKQFLRIHRSFLISISKIESFTNEYVEMHKNALPISRSYRKKVLEKLENI